MADISNRRGGRQYRQNNSARNSRSYYNGIDGNTARQLNAVPKRRERELPGQRPRRKDSLPKWLALMGRLLHLWFVCLVL